MGSLPTGPTNFFKDLAFSSFSISTDWVGRLAGRNPFARHLPPRMNGSAITAAGGIAAANATAASSALSMGLAYGATARRGAAVVFAVCILPAGG